jgi:hypothetical protein
VVRVLADYHHHALWESMRMLFEDRFGWELYRMTGMDWWDQGMWAWEKHMPWGEPVAHQNLDAWGDDRDMGDWSERDDIAYPGRTFKMLTVEQARAANIDIVLSTLTENEDGTAAFAREIGAKFGIQVGNQGTNNRYHLIDFALFSTTREHLPWVPYVFYRQEFSLEDFRFEYPPSDPTFCGTWVQALNADTAEFERFLSLAAAMPDLKFRYHGHVGPVDDHWGGNVVTTAEVAEQMRSARVGIHFKRWSDGYGHVLHNLFAVGKPVVATASYYKDKLGGPLFVDGVTSFDVQTRSKDEVVAIIRRLVEDDEYHEKISRAAAARFHEIVNFDAEAEQIRAMLDGVLSDARVAA